MAQIQQQGGVKMTGFSIIQTLDLISQTLKMRTKQCHIRGEMNGDKFVAIELLCDQPQVSQV